MGKLNPEKLQVEFRPGVTMTQPILGRKYTLTHSDITAELFLTVGLQFAYDKITNMRDEVLAEWKISNGCLFLNVYVYVGDYGPAVNDLRNTIFRRELPLALEAIVYGDQKYLKVNPPLMNAPIWIQFDSADPTYNRFEYWGTARDYRL
ncbi:staygreen family protein [Sutcliffiella horikoshii]|uniref:staygreen family protein n=1 Tax=Sutcliffiella horikoshii TaxID=79883 RepID=UPI001CBD83D4|nr:staygreen family protein [Sutcliffiella horikoshii]UAL47901.1 staygreen family protein [Sutcliffiella horikoshii]